MKEQRYVEMDYWFPVSDVLREELHEFVEWLCVHADEIAADTGVGFELLCRMDELEGDIRAAVYCGGIDEYAAAWLSDYYVHGGILAE